MAPADPVAAPSPSSSRTRCDRCARPLAGCWCACVRPVRNEVRLLILQHPDETLQAKNTAALLHRCLSDSRLLIGEQFTSPPTTSGMVLLYPGTPGDGQRPSFAPWTDGEPLHTLVALDATWRKSRRMLHLNPWLTALPRLSLQATPPSRYAIRRAHADDQRSTLEACALALSQVEGNEARYAPLWSAMEDFVRLQQRLLREGRARRAGCAQGESTSR